MRASIVYLLGIAAMTSAMASAAPVTIDPDAFDDGDIISDAFTDVTLSAQGGSYLVTDDVLAIAASPTSTGSHVFGRTSTTYFPEDRVAWGNGYGCWLQADFDEGALSVSVDFIADDNGDDGAVLRAFDASGVEVDSDASAGTFSSGQVVTLTVEAEDIAYVRAEADLGGGSAWRLDHLVYEPVPAPAVLPLLLIGAAPLLRRRRTPSRG